MSEWKTIDIAPDDADEEVILYHVGGGMFIARYILGKNYPVSKFRATHWMPLPTKPNTPTPH